MGGKGERRGAKGEGKGGPKGGGRGGAKNKFMFRGCWECSTEGYSRHECPAWKKIIDSQGRPPAGHKGAKDKAYASWKAKRDAAKAAGGKGAGAKTLNALSNGEEDTEGETDDDEWDEPEPGAMFWFTYRDCPPVPVSNRYRGL